MPVSWPSGNFYTIWYALFFVEHLCLCLCTILPFVSYRLFSRTLLRWWFNDDGLLQFAFANEFFSRIYGSLCQVPALLLNGRPMVDNRPRALIIHSTSSRIWNYGYTIHNAQPTITNSSITNFGTLTAVRNGGVLQPICPVQSPVLLFRPSITACPRQFPWHLFIPKHVLRFTPLIFRT